METASFDLAIVGGGIVGLSTAMAIGARWPRVRLVVLEKEPHLVMHQSSHNSGVIHSGIYYRPGSMKARLCVTGAHLLVEFCQTHGIPYEMIGKLIVATHAAEVPALQILYQRGVANGVAGLTMVGPERLREIEPHAHGVQALHVQSTGIADFASVARAFAEIVRARNGSIWTSARVDRLLRRHGTWILQTTAGDVQVKWLITCGGLYADRLAAMAGAPPDLRIVPFRGTYYELVPERRFLVKGLIYPLPNPALPFLGVHLTRTISGSVHAGPNAVLALKREGYRKTDVSVTDTMSLMTYRGFWKMAWRYRSVGVSELYRSWNKIAFVRAVQHLVPELRAEDLVPGESGVRAQALGRDGTLVDDFNIVQGNHAIHVCNAPSPAATASISIGGTVAERAASSFGFND